MKNEIRSFATKSLDSAGALADILVQLEGCAPAVIVFFAAHTHDGASISRSLRSRFPDAQILGCSTAGEFSEGHSLNGGVSGLALSTSKVKRSAAKLVSYDKGGVNASLQSALSSIAADLNIGSLRDVDPHQYVGVVLFDGLSGREEEANEVLGNIAPLLSFVGGSAGDGLEFKATKVFCNGEETGNGAALLLIDAAVPFTITKTCSFVPDQFTFKVTRADVPNRVVYELDGRPILDVYAEAVGVEKDKLDGSVFMSHPLGLMIEDQPWIRSPMQALPDGGLKFYCNISEGMDIRLMNSTDLVKDTREALVEAQERLGAPIAGGLAFNCVLRRLEMDANDLHGEFLRSFEGLQVGGFHTYGETWLGHMNQTLTAVWFA